MAWWFESSVQMAADNHRWMLWNSLLALVPALLAISLFRTPGRMGPLRVAGLVLFVLFLPNAPYVLTDVVHVFSAIRAGASDAVIVGVIVPVYTAFMLVGLGSYVYCLNRLTSWLVGGWRLTPRQVVAAELGVHLLCAIGVVLGRIMRLNSWQAVTDPESVAASTWIFQQPVGRAALVLAFGLCVGATWFGRSLAQSVRRLHAMI